MHALLRRTVARATSVVRPVAASPSSLVRASPSLASFVPRRSAFTYPSSRTLDEIVKLPMLIPHTRDEIIHIWNSHHQLARNAATTSDFISAGEYETFVEHAKRAPIFVVPSFRLQADTPAGEPFTFDVSAGFEMMLVNVQQSSLLLTSLEEYKSKGAGAATPYAVITLYSDMAASKDLVLIRAEMMDVNCTIPQLQQIWQVMKRCYITDASAFATFPEAFNRKPNPTFDFDAYIRTCTEQVQQMRLEQTKNTLEEEPQFVTAEETTTTENK